jgi:nucleolar complex protein 2
LTECWHSILQESFKTVYNWQYVHCIDFWANVFSTYCNTTRPDHDQSPLYSMIYPLTQIAIGAIRCESFFSPTTTLSMINNLKFDSTRLIPTAQYFPLRFHVVRSLISLANSTNVFIPLAPYIFEVFESSEVKKKGKPGTLKPLEWDVYIRSPKQFLHTKVYQVRYKR